MKCKIHNCEHIELSVYELDYISSKILYRLRRDILVEIPEEYKNDSKDVVEEAILDALIDMGF